MNTLTEKSRFEQYMATTRKRHLAYAARFTSNNDDAEDLVQEAQLRAIRALPTMKGDSIPDAWFRTIIKNCFLDLRRYRNRRQQTVSLDALQDSNPNFDLIDPSIPDPDSNLEALDPRLVEAIEQLPSEHKILVLASLNDLSSDEMSSLAKCAVTTVRTRLHRAHRSLRAYLGMSGFVPGQRSPQS
jgi:RNA polymerase sigma-70 factor, ECF subfamily